MLMFNYITPVMFTDSTGYAWWHVAIGAVIIGGLFIAANIATGGLASVLTGAAYGALTGAIVSAGFGGANYTNENGWSFDLENASVAFMQGSITGAIAGALSSASHFIGESIIKTTTFLKRIGYVGMQMGVNSFISASVTAVSGLMNNSFSWNSVKISAGFGAFSGLFGTIPVVSDGFVGVSIGFGLGVAEGSLNEWFDWSLARSNSDSQTLLFDFNSRCY